jgi:hypothetical protein
LARPSCLQGNENVKPNGNFSPIISCCWINLQIQSAIWSNNWKKNNKHMFVFHQISTHREIFYKVKEYVCTHVTSVLLNNWKQSFVVLLVCKSTDWSTCCMKCDFPHIWQICLHAWQICFTCDKYVLHATNISYMCQYILHAWQICFACDKYAYMWQICFTCDKYALQVTNMFYIWQIFFAGDKYVLHVTNMLCMWQKCFTCDKYVYMWQICLHVTNTFYMWQICSTCGKYVLHVANMFTCVVDMFYMW